MHYFTSRDCFICKYFFCAFKILFANTTYIFYCWRRIGSMFDPPSSTNNTKMSNKTHKNICKLNDSSRNTEISSRIVINNALQLFIIGKLYLCWNTPGECSGKWDFLRSHKVTRQLISSGRIREGNLILSTGAIF